MGFPEGRVEAIASELAGMDLAPLFDRWLRGTDELDFSAVAAAGLALLPAHEAAHAAPGAPPLPPEAMREVRVGFQWKQEGARTVVGNVLAGTPAWRAGLNAGDELVALDGIRVDPMSLGPRLQERAPGSVATLTVFRRDELVNLALPVEVGPPQKLVLRPVPDPTDPQRGVLDHWLREDPLAA